LVKVVLFGFKVVLVGVGVGSCGAVFVEIGVAGVLIFGGEVEFDVDVDAEVELVLFGVIFVFI
jgi:hypothetical protein